MSYKISTLLLDTHFFYPYPLTRTLHMFQLDEFAHWALTFYHFGHISAPLSLTLLCCACWVSAYSLLVISEIVAVPHLHVSTKHCG